jgi:hypothetical protein
MYIRWAKAIILTFTFLSLASGGRLSAELANLSTIGHLAMVKDQQQTVVGSKQIRHSHHRHSEDKHSHKHESPTKIALDSKHKGTQEKEHSHEVNFVTSIDSLVTTPSHDSGIWLQVSEFIDSHIPQYHPSAVLFSIFRPPILSSQS